MKKFPDPNGRAYKREKMEVYERFSPSVYPCKKCGWPVASGYCCSYCETDSPREET